MQHASIPFTPGQLPGTIGGDPTHPNPPAQEFAHVAGLINAMNGEALAPMSVDVPKAIKAALATAKRIAPVLDRMRGLIEFDIDLVLSLRRLAMALLYAHLLVDRPRVLRTTIANAMKLRNQLLASAQALVTLELADPTRVASLSLVGYGHSALAHSLYELAQLFRDIWEQASGRTGVTMAMLDRATELGGEILDPSTDSTAEGLTPGLSPKVVRRRAWTLLLRSYEECQRGVAFLEKGRVDELAPNLLTAGRRKGSPSTEDEFDEETSEDTPNEEGVGATSSES